MSKPMLLADVKKSIKQNVKTNSKGKEKKVFSEGDFTKIATALINTPDYTVKKAGLKGGVMSETDVKPVEDFRKWLGKLLKKYGVDKQEIDKFITDEVLDKADWLYGLSSAAIVEYLGVGKKFNFIPTSDLKASLTMEEVGKSTKEYKDMMDKSKTYKVETAKHNKIKVSSKAQPWNKKRVK